MVVEWGGMDDLELALAVEVTCYCCGRMVAVHPAARRLAKTVQVAAVQDMYMGIVGCWGSKEPATKWM
jgi:hypothetical protein